MEDSLREEQVEALQALMEYNKRLTKSIEMLIFELEEERKEDTDEFQKKIIDGINWEIEILNRTLSLLNEKEILIDKNNINQCILNLSGALKTSDDFEIAKALKEDILPNFLVIGEKVEIFLK